jgi:agmatine/peptidylarginine deiminase
MLDFQCTDRNYRSMASEDEKRLLCSYSNFIFVQGAFLVGLFSAFISRKYLNVDALPTG